MRRRLLLGKSEGGSGTNPSEATPLEVVFYNSALNGLVIRKQEDWIDGEIPIGMVIVPGAHNRYGDGTCGVMSLVEMDCNNPEIGAPITGNPQPFTQPFTHTTVRVGRHNYEEPNVFKGTNDGGTNYKVEYQTDSASTEATVQHYIWPYALDSNHAVTTGASQNYKNNNSYVQATTGSSLGDCNGIRNTVAYYVNTRTSAQWTANTVCTNGIGADCPARICAGRFKTVGTKSLLDMYSGITSVDLNYGTSSSTKSNTNYWYLPGQGELSYIPRWSFEIDKTVLAINEKYGNVSIPVNGYAIQSSDIAHIYIGACLYASSTVPSSQYDLYVFVIDSRGGVGTSYKSNNNCSVRAFMRLGVNDVI